MGKPEASGFVRTMSAVTDCEELKMEVILLENVGNLGSLGDKVDVKSGYGRNFLIPQGKAVPATEDNVAKFEARRAELEAAAQEALSAAEKRAAAVTELAAEAKSRKVLVAPVAPSENCSRNPLTMLIADCI